MIDLHIHTKYSDGTWSLEETLKKIEESKLEIFSITDHNTAGAYFELNKNPELRNICTGEILIGAEIDCSYNGTRIEVLAYDFKLEPVQRWFDEYYSKENKNQRLLNEFNDLVTICNKNNIKIEDELKYDLNDYPVDVIFDSVTKFDSNQILFDEETWNDKSAFFRRTSTDKNFILYRDFTKDVPTLEEISKLIHNNNGKIFLAHLFKYKLEEPMKYLDEISKSNLLDGIEVYHSSFSKEEIKKLEEYCKVNNLMISGGSDCHGEKKKERKIGIGYDNLNISKEILNTWK